MPLLKDSQLPQLVARVVDLTPPRANRLLPSWDKILPKPPSVRRNRLTHATSCEDQRPSRRPYPTLTLQKALVSFGNRRGWHELWITSCHWTFIKCKKGCLCQFKKYIKCLKTVAYVTSEEFWECWQCPYLKLTIKFWLNFPWFLSLFWHRQGPAQSPSTFTTRSK